MDSAVMHPLVEYRRRMVQVCKKEHVPADDLEDVLQEVAEIYLRKVQTATIENPEAWLVTVTYNRCVVYWRRYRVQVSRNGGRAEDYREDLAVDDDSHRIHVQVSLDRIIARHAGSLKPRDLEHLKLRRLGLRPEEIAKRLGVDSSYERKLFSRIIGQLKGRVYKRSAAVRRRMAKATAKVWADRTLAERLSIGAKISAAGTGRKKPLSARRKLSESVRRSWVKLSPDERRDRLSAAVEAARRIDPGIRRRISQKASLASASAPLPERQRRGQAAAATRKARGTGYRGIGERSRAIWATMTPEERGAECRRRALLRWERQRSRQAEDVSRR